MNTERGSALVQVLVMSVLLTILATGVMKVMFMGHVAVAKVQNSEKMRDAVERCYAHRMADWQGSPCGGSTGSSDCTAGNITVKFNCSGPTVVMTAQ